MCHQCSTSFMRIEKIEHLEWDKETASHIRYNRYRVKCLMCNCVSDERQSENGAIVCWYDNAMHAPFDFEDRADVVAHRDYLGRW